MYNQLIFRGFKDIISIRKDQLPNLGINEVFPKGFFTVLPSRPWRPPGPPRLTRPWKGCEEQVRSLASESLDLVSSSCSSWIMTSFDPSPNEASAPLFSRTFGRPRPFSDSLPLLAAKSPWGASFRFKLGSRGFLAKMASKRCEMMLKQQGLPSVLVRIAKGTASLSLPIIILKRRVQTRRKHVAAQMGRLSASSPPTLSKNASHPSDRLQLTHLRHRPSWSTFISLKPHCTTPWWRSSSLVTPFPLLTTYSIWHVTIWRSRPRIGTEGLGTPNQSLTLSRRGGGARLGMSDAQCSFNIVQHRTSCVTAAATSTWRATQSGMPGYLVFMKCGATDDAFSVLKP